MARGIINYNGFDIDPSALDDDVLSMLGERGLLPEQGVMSRAPAAPTPGLLDSPTGEALPPGAGLIDTELFARARNFDPSRGLIGSLQTPSRDLIEQDPAATTEVAQAETPLARTEDAVPFYNLPFDRRPAPQGASNETPTVQKETPELEESAATSREPTPEEQIIGGVESRLRSQGRVAENQARALDNLAAQRDQTAEQLDQTRQQFEQARQDLEDRRRQYEQDFNEGEITEFWSERTNTQRILGSLAIAVGEFGAALTGGQNPAYQIIQDAMDRHRTQQLDQINKARQGIADTDNNLSQLINTFQNERAAILEFDNLNAQAAINELEKIKLEGVSEQTNAIIDETIGKLRLDQRNNRLQQIQELQKLQRDSRESRRESPAQKAIDSAFGKRYEEFWLGGKAANTRRQINDLKRAVGFLETGNVTGPVTGVVPDSILRAINPDAVTTRDLVESVVQTSLRETLGAQFTEKEAERLIERSFNARLGEEENLRRVKALIRVLEDSYSAQEAAAEYYEQNNTLAGFPGLAINRELAQVRTAEDVERLAGIGEQGDSGQSQRQQQILNSIQFYQNRLQQDPNDEEAAEALERLQGLMNR